MDEMLRNGAKSVLQGALGQHRFIWRYRGPQPAVRMTFDDGPNEAHTGRLLDLLARHQIKATFFLIGENVLRHPELARRIAEQGHAIGGHSFNHSEMPALSGEELSADLKRCQSAIERATGIQTLLYRPPRGRMSASGLLRTARLGYQTVHWSISYADYLRDGLPALLQRMRSRPPTPGDIVMMHDDHSNVIDALETLLPEWLGRGMQFDRMG